MGRKEIHKYYSARIADRFDNDKMFEALVAIAMDHHPEYSEEEAIESVFKYLEDRMAGNLHDL